MIPTERIIEKVKNAAPSRMALTETIGFAVVAFGLFMLLVLVFHGPAVIDAEGTPRAARSIGGPAGAAVAEFALRWLGSVGLVWAAAPIVWGGLMILGFIRWPAPKRVLALGLLTFVLCGWAHILPPPTGFLHQPAGFGGTLGAGVSGVLLGSVGRGGALIALGMAAIAILVLTGNLSLSKTAGWLETAFFTMTRAVQRKATTSANSTKPASRATSAATDAGGDFDNDDYDEDDDDITPARAARDPEADAAELGFVDFSSSTPRHSRPDLSIFRARTIARTRQSELTRISEMLEEQLKEFKVDGRISGITEGPVVTTVEFEPAPGTKAAKIVGLGEDLARLLEAQSLRVLAPIPGRSTVGFEVPNTQRRIIGFGNVLKEFRKRSREMSLPIVLGVDTFGHAVVEDLAEMPHLLVAGSTGSGKSVFINTLITSLVCRRTARELRMVMIDPKMVELAAYNRLPHLSCPVVHDIERHGQMILDALVEEMEDRYRRLNALSARNIHAFNDIIKNKNRARYKKYEGKWQTMPWIVVIVDEFADLISMLGKDAEAAVARLAQKARAAGIHLVVATQRPSVNVVTGVIKANFPTRVAFRVLSGVDSRTILDQGGAETLLGKGDMLYQSAKGIQRLHAPFIQDNEVNRIVKACA